ncbi:PREDICTED: uncharacterized protein LOC109477071 isoform X1 [Branchiostoma belcheri]|uniref:Uncharacterized protein LOC109477071 isoform X1 n=1 Tax=Branchiostoma belcheri TaxID=7741 RepID=A0A6P4YWF1_BRABE|nr:PREDICTED: uncharacterized protein LOC109477071 isoform X1 [Branchiostoma belcheri]
MSDPRIFVMDDRSDNIRVARKASVELGQTLTSMTAELGVRRDWFWSVLSLIQQAWNSDDYQVQLCMVALGWILLNILLILLAWRRHGSSISDMFRRQGTPATCRDRLSPVPVFNKRPTWQDKSHLNGTNFNSSTGLPNGNGLPNGSHLPNGRLRTVSEKSHQS